MRWRLFRRVGRKRRVKNRARVQAHMPGHLSDGTRVWLHSNPLRWERRP